jgi:drug/metabolite transporter superfamily protein YnfA
MNLQTAKQISIREALSRPLRLAFDVEFARKRISTWIYFLLSAVLGLFGAHFFYLWLKDPDENWEHVGPVLFAYLFGWSKILSNNQTVADSAGVVVSMVVFCHTLWVIFSGQLRNYNDRIAQNVARELG